MSSGVSQAFFIRLKVINMNDKRRAFLFIGMLICICTGFGYAWSVFQTPLINKFGWSTAEVSLTFTFNIMTTALVPGLVGKMLNYIKTRLVILIGGLIFSLSVIGSGYVQTLGQLYLAAGIGTGLGIGILYPSITAYSVKIFPDRRGLVAGLLAASFGSGAIIWAPIAVYITEKYGVLTAYKVLGIFFLVVICLLSRRIIDDPSNSTIKENNSNTPTLIGLATDKTWKEMLRSSKYYIVAGIFAIGSTSGLMIMGHASPIVQETLKVSSSTAAFVVGLIAIANTIGRLFWGWLSDRIGRYPTIIILFVIVTFSMIIMATMSQALLFVSMILAIGFCYGGFAALMAPLTADTFGIRYLNENYGFMYLAYGIGGILGPRLAALTRDLNNGEYTGAFIVAASISILGILLCVFSSRRKLGFPNKRMDSVL